MNNLFLDGYNPSTRPFFRTDSEMLELFLRWLHIFFAIILVGGLVFQRCVVFPALELCDGDQRSQLQEAMRRPWARLVMASSAVLLISGLVNAVRNILRYDFAEGTYHMLVAVKLLLALAIFWFSAVLSGRSSTAERFRQNAALWLNVNIGLAVLLVCLAGFMRAQDRREKPGAPTLQSASAAARIGELAPNLWSFSGAARAAR